ncbi:MAG: 4a-hydroxytetrahydrobiopterin dehydratase [Chloroflexi bacterium]|nr:MAG: 4a-hydroxytetrahydrobiopterin dehydratase [Chloroflexota bacterium]
MAAELADEKCVPCRGGTPPLQSDQIAVLLPRVEGWRVEDERKLVKSFKFRDWLDAVAFVNEVTPIAEAEGHHPDLYVRWGQVTAYLWTHKIDGLTTSDFVMAAKLDRAFGAHRPAATSAGATA